MAVTLHAIMLILLPIGSLGAVCFLKRRVPTSRQFVVALGLTTIATIAAPEFNHHLCREGEPRNQWLILAPCLLLTLVLVKSNAWRRALSTSVFLGMMGLSCHFTDVVHTHGWTGNPTWDGGSESRLRGLRNSIEAEMIAPLGTDAALPAGWLRELPIDEELKATLQNLHLLRRRVRPAWHSPITGLFQYDTVPQDFWYPGGPFKQLASRIELRDRAN